MFIRSKLYRNIAWVVVFCLLFAPLPVNTLWWREVFNSGHTVLFAVLSFVIYRRIKAATHFSNNLAVYFLVLIAGISFGILIELLQSFAQRDASLNDLYGDFFGLLAGVLLIAAYNLRDIRHKKLVAAFLVMVASSFMLLGMFSLIQLSWYSIERRNAFPVIVDFGADWSLRFVRFKNVDTSLRMSPGRELALYPVRFNRGEYPGISVIEPESDWSNYRLLRLNIFSEYEHDVAMSLRIHDDKHNQYFSDRFNMRLLIRPGLNRVEVPLDQVERGPVSRDLDMTNIAGIILFVAKVDEPVRLELGNIFLE